MKYISFVLLLFPFLCFSQTGSYRTPTPPSKPSSTDCPTWDNKNKPKNKADYYRSLRSMKPMKGPDTSKNKYANNKPKAATKKVNIAQAPVEKSEIKKDTVSVVKTEVKEKSDKEDEKNIKKTKRLPHRKTTKARRKKTTGCPQF